MNTDLLSRSCIVYLPFGSNVRGDVTGDKKANLSRKAKSSEAVSTVDSKSGILELDLNSI